MAINGFELSPQQKYLWLLQQENSNSIYLVQGSVLIKGKINYEILEKAINQVFVDYEIMRSDLKTIEGMTIPLQVINEPQRLSLDYLFNSYDLNLDSNSLVRIGLRKISDLEHILSIKLSGLVADIISFFNVVKEIIKNYYNNIVINETLQYADFSAWQNELLIEEDAQRGKQYWQNIVKQLSVPKLGYEKNILGQNYFAFQAINLNISDELYQKIKLYASQYQVSVATVVMATWQLLLWRLTQESEIILGWGCDCRNYEELKSVLGLLNKYLPINNPLAENQNFGEVLQQLEKKLKEGNQWAEYFNGEELKRNQEQLFLPFLFEFISQPRNYGNEDLLFRIESVSSYLEKFKLKLLCWEAEEQLTAQLNYDFNLFAEEDIDRLSRQYKTLLESAIDNPKKAIALLNILSPEEAQHLKEFSQTINLVPVYECVHYWIEEQVQKNPHQIAVICQEKQLTYQELDNKANQVAQYLQFLGVQPNQIVGLLVERSLDLAIGILGILKSGAAYLPLESNLPPDALAFRLEDAQVPVVLTQKHLVNKIDHNNNCQIVCFEGIKESNLIKCQPNISGENLAYVIYTSGSTGKPRSVPVQHKQLINYLSSVRESLNLPINANYATISTFSADLGNTIIFSALCTASTWHILTENQAKDPVVLADYCLHHPLDCLKIVPSHLSALLISPNAINFLPRQCLILGGEILTWELIKKVRNIIPECNIFNHYGPTETTIGVLTYHINVNCVNSSDGTQIVPLGRPLANTQIHLLDKYQQPVPMGISGEICISGANVTIGYINQPELTATKFIKKDGNLLYKTGDLGRYLPDGNIEFLGRIDDQIKLHGFRIELGEIEAVLRQHPQVKDIVVVFNNEQINRQFLSAYFVAQGEDINCLESVLADFLKEKLPEYMIPSYFIQLNALPLTANGKIDRKNLPAPETVKLELTKTFVAPRTREEVILAQIWSKLLNLEKISVNDNFFELGGDSIISIQAIAKANELGLRLTPKQIFEHQTIAKLAPMAEISNKFKYEQVSEDIKVPLTPIQKSFFEQDFLEPHHWNQSILLELKQSVNPDYLEQAVKHLLEHHEALRSHFQADSAGISSIQKIPFTQLDFTNIAKEKQKEALKEISTQIQTSLNLSEGRLLQVVLLNLGNAQPSRLLIVIHHLVIDGVSWRILLEDLQTLLSQLNQGQSLQLPAKTTSYPEWACRLLEYAQTEKINAELNYWCRESKVQFLPRDYLDVENTEAVARSIAFSLTQQETQSLLKEVPFAYHTQINDIFLTALVQAFSQWTQESQLLIALEGHGREEIFSDVDLSRSVGWFTSVFPVLLDINNADSPIKILKIIKEQIRSIPSRGINYGILRYLKGDQALANMPSPEVCFNYLGQFNQLLADSSWFNLASESSGVNRSPLNKRQYLFNINAYVIEEKLKVDWIYSSKIHQENTILTLAESFMQGLKNLINHCRSPEASSYIPADFPQANLNQQQLDQLFAKINQLK